MDWRCVVYPDTISTTGQQLVALLLAGFADGAKLWSKFFGVAAMSPLMPFIEVKSKAKAKAMGRTFFYRPSGELHCRPPLNLMRTKVK
jgi:hypothetical protein